jgi:hypothetical protein
MHHYRYQNVYITSTASERIVDTLDFFPHNSPMPQLSSADRLIMAANDMSDALQNPHPDAPFNTVRDDTVSALTTLSAIFKRKYNKIPAQHLIDSLIKAAEKTPCSINPTCADISNQAHLSNKITNTGVYKSCPRQ